MCTDHRNWCQRGVSLVEMIIFLVIVSVAVVGLLSTMSLTSSSSGEPLRRKQALMIAESLMEEILLARFTLCDADDPDVLDASVIAAVDCGLAETVGPTAGETRPYNHINDYVTALGVKQAAFNHGGVLVDASLAPYPAGYSATLLLTEAALNGIGGSDALSYKVSIAVTDSVTGEVLTLESFRFRYAPNSPP